MPSNRFFGDLKDQREQWKTETLHAGYTPEELDYSQFRRRASEQPEEYEIPELPLNKRFEGAWIVGTQGSGKTAFFKQQIKNDLDEVAAGRASLFILDPTGDQPEVRAKNGDFLESSTLVRSVVRLKRFAPGGDLHGRLVYINPEERNYTIPINLFSLRADDDDEDAADSVQDSYVSIINGLLGQELTRHQDTALRAAILATMASPSATLATLQEMLAIYPPATKNYTPPQPAWQHVVHKLDAAVQVFFRTSYDSQRDTRSAVLARLGSLLMSNKFRRIFTQTRPAQEPLDIPALINKPSVIVINASRDYLGTLKELYGRFFLSLLKRAGEARPSGSIPCFAYVDECDEFCGNDQYTGEIIFKLRRKRVAIHLGNQATSQIRQENTKRAFFSTAIKLVNVNEPDSAKEMAEALNLRTGMSYNTAPFLGRSSFDFAYFCRDITKDGPIPFRFKPGVLESEPQMSEAEWREVWKDIRDRYYVPTKSNLRPDDDEPSEPRERRTWR